MNPCCCMSLRTGSFAIAIFCVIGYSIEVYIAIYGIVQTINQQSQQTEAEAKGEKVDLESLEILLIFLIISLVIDVIRLIVSIILVVGVQKSSASLLKIWLVVQCVMFFVSLAYFIALNKLIIFIPSLVTVYYILVIACFGRELKDIEGPAPKGAPKFPPTTKMIKNPTAAPSTKAADLMANGHV